MEKYSSGSSPSSSSVIGKSSVFTDETLLTSTSDDASEDAAD